MVAGPEWLTEEAVRGDNKSDAAEQGQQGFYTGYAHLDELSC